MFWLELQRKRLDGQAMLERWLEECKRQAERSQHSRHPGEDARRLSDTMTVYVTNETTTVRAY